MLAAVGATVASFDLLQNQTTSIIPIMFCIMFGFLLCLFGVSMLRWLSAKKLQQFQLHRHPSQFKPSLTPSDVPPDDASPQDASQAQHPNVVLGADGDPHAQSESDEALKDHIRILKTVIALKKRGAAGGRNHDMLGMFCHALVECLLNSIGHYGLSRHLIQLLVLLAGLAVCDAC
jgi:hypothetical protein